MTTYTDRNGNVKTIEQINREVSRAEHEIHAAKMGITYNDLMALRRHPDKAWARTESLRLLNANKKR